MAEPTPLVVLGQVAAVTHPSPALTTAARAGLTSVDDHGDVDCAHDVLREAILHGLSTERRRELHSRAARHATGDRKLAHRAAAQDRPDPQLVADLLDAADSARASLKYGVAAAHRLRARTVSADAAEREGLLLDALIERVEAQELDLARELVGLAHEAAASPHRSLALGLYACENGEVGAARSLLRESIDLAEAAGDQAAAARAALAAAVLEVRLGDGAAALALLCRTADTADGDRDPEIATDIRTTTGLALWHTGDFDRALAQLATLERRRASTPWEADLVAVRGMFTLFKGHVADALNDLDEAVGLMHIWRPSTNQSRIFFLRSMARFHVGDWDGAAVDAAAARALAEGPALLWSAALALSVSVDVPANRGQWDVAEDYLARAEMTSPLGHQLSDVVVSHRIGLALAKRDYHEVLRVLDPLWSDAYLERISRNRTLRSVMQARVTACIAAGRLEDAERDLDRYEELSAQWPGGEIPLALGWLRGLLAEAWGKPRAAQVYYASDLGDPALSGYPFQLAQLLLASGRLERAMGNRREAVDRLTRARAIFAGLRATPFLERCTDELVACGLRSPITDPLALTAREEDVVALVMRGYTNAAIATELFLTAKTVEWHLRNVYAKLGVSNRHELRRRRSEAVLVPPSQWFAPDGGTQDRAAEDAPPANAAE
jgi:DNA-binding CsgD family transcriptional regulator